MHIEWKDAPGFIGKYQVSSDGELRHTANPEKKIIGEAQGGYRRATLKTPDGLTKRVMVHRIVAHAFLGEPKGGQCVNHKNSIRNDNRVVNLEWVTQRENVHHGWEFGKCYALRGEGHGSAKLSEAQVIEIKRRLLTQKRGDQTRLAEEFGITKHTIYRIHKGKIWAHIK